jgi:malate dehydrogenase (quinone)
LLNAGQRAQVIKKDAKKGGVLQFGTEVITSADGSISGLLGASPGASTAVHVMLQVIERCFPNEFASWRKPLVQIVPSFGTSLNANPKQAKESLAQTAKTLKLR